MLSLDDGTTCTGRLLVTSGIEDELPDLPGVAERWGRDVLYCPYCHGGEIRNQQVGVLASNAHAVSQALTFRQWSQDVTLLLNDELALSPGEAEQLEARSVKAVDGRVRGLVVQDDKLRVACWLAGLRGTRTHQVARNPARCESAGGSGQLIPLWSAGERVHAGSRDINSETAGTAVGFHAGGRGAGANGNELCPVDVNGLVQGQCVGIRTLHRGVAVHS